METELLLNIMENLANGNIPGVVAAISVVVWAMVYQFRALRKQTQENQKEIKTTIKELEVSFQGKIDRVEERSEKSHNRLEGKIDKIESEIKDISQSVFFLMKQNKISPKEKNISKEEIYEESN